MEMGGRVAEGQMGRDAGISKTRTPQRAKTIHGGRHRVFSALVIARGQRRLQQWVFQDRRTNRVPHA
eukprot:4179972-Pyramimonas_sp.AAC.1